MNCMEKVRELRESTGMNRREFCDFFQIPYRTVTEWERGNRHAPEYVIRLLEYYIRMEQLDDNYDEREVANESLKMTKGGDWYGSENSKGNDSC